MEIKEPQIDPIKRAIDCKENRKQVELWFAQNEAEIYLASFCIAATVAFVAIVLLAIKQ